LLRRTLARTGRRTQGWGWSPPRPRHGLERLSSVTTNAGDGLSIHWSRRADAGAEQRIGPNSEEIHAAAVAGCLACRSILCHVRLSGRSPDSVAHRGVNRGGERQAIEQRSLRVWEGSPTPMLAVDHPKGPVAPPGSRYCQSDRTRGTRSLLGTRLSCALAADESGGPAAVPTRRSGTGALRRGPSRPTTRHRRDHACSPWPPPSTAPRYAVMAASLRARNQVTVRGRGHSC